MSMQPTALLLSLALFLPMCGLGTTVDQTDDGPSDFRVSEVVLSGGIAGICEQLQIDPTGTLTFVESCFSPSGENRGQLTPLGENKLDESVRDITTEDFNFDPLEPQCCDMFSFGLAFTSGTDTYHISQTGEGQTPEVFRRSIDLAGQLLTSLRNCETTELVEIQGDCAVG